ncbi:hypothetical protein D3C83_93770 [compost metagenome]
MPDRDSCVVDENVDRAERFLDARDHGGDVPRVGNIGGEGCGSATELFDGSDGRCGFILAPTVVDSDVGARFGERGGDRFADAT